MKTSVTNTRLRGLLLAAGVLTLTQAACALDASGVTVHGSISATASYSSTYNYLGDTRDRLDLNITEAIINGSRRFDNGVRVGAQVYAYDAANYSDITLDWANADYSFKPWFGVRAGRNKVPLGLCNDTQDLDSVRTFASLPLSHYPKAYRPITSSSDGLCFYGNVSLGKAGSLDYQVHGGVKEDIDGATPFVKGRNNLATYDSWDVKRGVFGASLFWNTPVEGLRFGYSHFLSPKNFLYGKLNKSSLIYGDYRAMIALAGSATAWDAGVAGAPVTVETRVEFHALSAEYTTGKWQFGAEYKLQDNTPTTFRIPSLKTVASKESEYEEYYGMVTYQATSKIGLGFYYSYENLAKKGTGSSSNPFNYTKDWAAAISYAASDAWVFKLEGHALRGRSLVFSGAGDDNYASGTKDDWTYFVVKSTFSF